MITAPEQPPPLTSLRLRWAITALVGALLLWGGYRLFAVQWQPGYAARWLALASMAMAYLLWVLWRSLEHNHRHGETRLLSGYGAGNSMTILRGALIAGLTGFLFLPWPPGWMAWIPGALYTAAALADFLDGYLARITDRTTRMGEILDLSFDGLGVLVASVLAVQYGQVPLWYLAVALARYIFMGATWLRRRQGLPVHELPPSVRRRTFAGIQMGFLFFILMPVFSPPGTHIAALVFAAPFLAGFMIDWQYTCGRLQRQSPRREAGQLALKWLPVGLRAAAVILLVGQITGGLLRNPGQVPDIATPVTFAFMLAQAAVMIMLALGVSSRFTAILGLSLLGIQQMTVSLSPVQVMLVILYTAILYLGSGAFSLWKPEERLIYRRAGEKVS